MLAHDCFVGSAEAWVAEEVKRRGAERAARAAPLAREREQLVRLDRKVGLAQASYDDALGDDGLASAALRQVARLEAERDAQRDAISDAESALGEWTAESDADAALDYYSGLVDLVQGRVRQADGADDLNRALASVLTGLGPRSKSSATGCWSSSSLRP